MACKVEGSASVSKELDYQFSNVRVCLFMLECAVTSKQTRIKRRAAAGRVSVCVPATDYRAHR